MKRKHLSNSLRSAALALTLLALALGMLPADLSAKADATGWNSGYDPSAAVAYAQKYALEKNSSYTYFENNDCCSFVSQCLRAGGLADNYLGTGWYYVWGVYSLSWSYCPSLMAFLKEQGINVIKNPNYTDIRVGDVVFYDLPKDGGPDGELDHVTICSAISYWGMPQVCGHTSDRLNVDYNYAAEGTIYYVAQVAPRNNTGAQTQQAGTGATVSYPCLMDVSAVIDGYLYTTLGKATMDVYIDGKLVADDVSDFYQYVNLGSRYEIQDIKTNGYAYLGLYAGALSGTVQGYTAPILSFSSQSTASASQVQSSPAPSDWSISVDGVKLYFTPGLYMENSRLMAPAWVIASNLGAQIAYFTSETISLWYNGKQITFTAGKQTYSAGGTDHSALVTPSSIQYTLYVGVRDLADALGVGISTDATARAVLLTKAK